MGFQKGNKVGKQFTKENQPEENGRKPKIKGLDILLAEVIGDDGYTEIINSLKQEAKNGKGSNKVRAAEILLDRQYGKAKQHIELEGTIDLKPAIIIKPVKPEDEQPS